ncbi:patatin [Leptospira langatensis]|uniref:Patatin n=1 Tax=Leptospira langatensis TaxID=2484983 RepID=A0A5F1ZZG6_9LEPT|nr:patatin-like phospholipase family protein [Leptospira langatensis]TGK04160.1 patatin [Leptospira langatensis]TGL43640.1 patatin [Leptospira langatensis]
MKRILQIDGGGILGIMPALVLVRLEALLKKLKRKSLTDSFDLITGSSTGAIIGGAVAAGVPIQAIADLYIKKGANLFTPRSKLNPANWIRPKYDRTPFVTELNSIKTSDGKFLGQLKMKDLKTSFMATSFNLCSQRTHFLKSWDKSDGHRTLADVITWSALSAAYYFGKINVPGFKWTNYSPDGKEKVETGAVFQDGGQGINNNTIHYILTEILANDWEDKGSLIVSLGTGNVSSYVSYAEASKTDFFQQIAKYPFQARKESTLAQVLEAGYIAQKNPDMRFHRFDTLIQEEENELDKVEFINRFVSYGQKIADTLDESFIKKNF